ncbi:Phosphoethanolamine N-methyltransferase [Escovopsis weberi]|uniref:Phosphoethanolamine N-methyltransferase n=1 Tax=Escovopsis weberi TaxID=150374 RepID=A0A0M8MT67_ESCWE|nr:Phosphoethanolamine N-methyltransferase [Escovopsis weberi]
MSVRDEPQTGSAGSLMELDDGQGVSLYHHNGGPQGSGSYRLGRLMSDDLRTMHGVSDVASTRSLWERELDYSYFENRRYGGEYFMPNDEVEQVRLTLVHQLLLQALDNEITVLDLPDPTHVLDVGTGTGEWAIHYAEMYPNCEVVGTDVAAIGETKGVPINVFFEIEDAEEWDRPLDHYDLVHMRWMSGAFRDWKYVYSKAYESIKPGGWIEVQDCTNVFEAFLEHLPVGSELQCLFENFRIATARSGRPFNPAHLEPAMLMNAGFVDVMSMEHVLPLGCPDKSLRSLWAVVCIDYIEAVFLRTLIEHMGWDPQECKAKCDAAAWEVARILKEASPGSETVAIRMRVIVGRKPQCSTQPARDSNHANCCCND